MNYINLLSESSYVDTLWYKRIMAGISKKINQRRDTIRNMTTDEICNMHPGSVLLIIGFSRSFLNKAVELCLSNEIRPLIVGSNIDDFANQNVSFVSTTRELAMYENVVRLYKGGCKRIAMIGVNPQVSTDQSHKEGYCQAAHELGLHDYEASIFYNTVGITKAIDAFLNVRHNYDAVVCTNDFVAVMLLSYLNDLDVKVPDELAVTGAGNTDCCKWTSPTLTSIDIPLETAGKSAVILYHTLCDNPHLTSLNSKFGYDIVYRGSTKIDPQDKMSSLAGYQSFTPLLDTDYESDMRPIWNIANAYSMVDDVDRRIIGGILQNQPNSKLAEKTYISESTLHYRLNKLYKATGTSGKSELRELLMKYFPNYNF